MERLVGEARSAARSRASLLQTWVANSSEQFGVNAPCSFQTERECPVVSMDAKNVSHARCQPSRSTPWATESHSLRWSSCVACAAPGCCTGSTDWMRS